MGVRRVEYLPVSGLVADERNPKLHDELTIRESISRFGVLDPIVRDERTGRIIHGHGRAVVLRLMQEAGDTVPGGVQVAADGVWLVPVVVGWSSKDDAEAGAALVALNRTTASVAGMMTSYSRFLMTSLILRTVFSVSVIAMLTWRASGDLTTSTRTRHQRLRHRLGWLALRSRALSAGISSRCRGGRVGSPVSGKQVGACGENL